MPKSKKRTRSAAARVTQVEQERAEKKLTPKQYARRRAFGWSLVVVGVVVGVSHWVAHLGVLYDDKPLWDLLIGYPTAGLFGIGGAIVLSK